MSEWSFNSFLTFNSARLRGANILSFFSIASVFLENLQIYFKTISNYLISYVLKNKKNI